MPIEELETTEQLEETTTAVVEKTEKQYSESEVQKMIKDRLSRERDTIKSLREELIEARKESDEEVKWYKDILQSEVDKLMTTVPASVKTLLGKLSVKEQLEWLSNPENVIIESKKIPQTPKTETVEKQVNEDLMSKLRIIK